MDRKAILGNITVAFAAQGISMLASVIMSLLVPKVLGVSAYGYWQLFIFYASYSGFFHLGLNDGLYLLLGGTPRSKVDKTSINSQFHFALTFQLVVGLVVAMVAIISASPAERSFVMLAFAAYTAIYNLSAFLGYVFQAMNETKLFSFSTMLDRITFLVPMLFMIVLRVDDFRPYIVMYIIARICSLSYCCFKAKDILMAGSLTMRETIKVSTKSIKVGCSLMLANIGDSLILGATRFFIDTAWGIEVFGSVSFALSLVNFFITFVSQAAMVLFPVLRQGSSQERRSFYQVVRDLMEIAFPMVYLLYFPMCFALSQWLPQYTASMSYFAILLPVCVFNTKMNICCTTYFKVMRMERLLLAVNAVTFVLSALFSAVSIWLLHSIELALISTVGCIICRSFWCERHLDGIMDVPASIAAVAEIVLTAAFVAMALLLEPQIGFCLYFAAYALYLLLNRNTFIGSFRKLLRRV